MKQNLGLWRGSTKNKSSSEITAIVSKMIDFFANLKLILWKIGAGEPQKYTL